MALAYGTSPVGAHHKDAWVIGWETPHDRFGYGEEKAARVIEAQHTRGAFELLGVCRFPLVNLGFDREWYPKYLQLGDWARIHMGKAKRGIRASFQPCPSFLDTRAPRRLVQ